MTKKSAGSKTSNKLAQTLSHKENFIRESKLYIIISTHMIMLYMSVLRKK